MSQGRRIAESSTALLVGNVANKLTGFLIMLTVVPLLGPDRFGLYTTVFAYVGVFALATDLGLTTVVIRRLSQQTVEARRWLGNALLLRWSLAAASYVICVGSAFALYGTGERTFLITISALSFLLSPLATHSAVFHARLRLSGLTVLSLVLRLLLLAAVQWLARNGGTLTALVVIEVVIGAITNVVIWLWSRKFDRALCVFDKTIVRSLLWEGIPLFLTSAFISLYFRIDVFFIDHYWDSAEVGMYGAAYRLTEAMPMIAAAVSNSIFPVLCQHIHLSNETAANRLIRISLKILLATGVALAILMPFYSETVTAVLYKGRFPGAAPVLTVLTFNQILVFTNILLTTLLVARGQNRAFMFLTMGMLVWNVLLNSIVIQRYGALGAAWTTLATELAGTIGCLILTSTAGLFLRTAARLAMPAAIGVALLSVIAPASVQLSAGSLLPAAAALVVYGVAVFVLKLFDSDELAAFRQFSGRRLDTPA